MKDQNATYDRAIELGIEHVHLTDSVAVLRGTQHKLDALAREIEEVAANYLLLSYEHIGDNADEWADIVKPFSFDTVSAGPRNPFLVVVETRSDDLQVAIQCLSDHGVVLELLTSRLWLARVPDHMRDVFAGRFRDHIRERLWDCTGNATDYVVVRVVAAATDRADWFTLLSVPRLVADSAS